MAQMSRRAIYDRSKPLSNGGDENRPLKRAQWETASCLDQQLGGMVVGAELEDGGRWETVVPQWADTECMLTGRMRIAGERAIGV